jgi:hypothetical protein
MVYIQTGDGLDGWRGIGQSEPWEEEGIWSSVQANRKKALFGAPEGWFRQEKEKEKKLPFQGTRKEYMDKQHGLWQ